ncbi:MAG: YesL family protein [Roseburia sp.]
MGDFFNMDNKFFQVIGKLVDCVGLSVLWLFCCIPVLTAGPATTALYYTVNKVIRHGRSYVWREYWHAFRSSFKQSFCVGLVVLALGAFFSWDCYIMYQYALAGEGIGRLYIVFIVMIVLLLMWVNYLFPYIARFENGTKAILKNAIYMAVANIPTTILAFVLLLGVALLVYLAPYALMILPAGYMFVLNFMMERVFRKYMSPEDLAAEDERNAESF